MPEGVVFLPSFYAAIQKLDDSERLNAYDAVIRYGLYGEVVDMTPYVEGFFTLIQPVIDASHNRYRAAVENGKKGGRPPKSQADNQIGNQKENQDMDDEKDLESAYDSNKETDAARDMEPAVERERESLRGSGRTVYTPPAEDAFEKMREQGLAKLAYSF